VTFDPAAWGAAYAEHYTRTPIGPKARIICHHTATGHPSSAAAAPGFVRQLEQYGHNRDGADVEYHALIDRYGQVFEGFAPRYRGCHCIAKDASTGNSKSYNDTSLGLCFIGYFYSDSSHPVPDVPTPQALEAGAKWIAARVADGDLDRAVLDHANNATQAGWRGHREVDATACPGTLLTQGYLAQVFDRARALIDGPPPPGDDDMALTYMLESTFDHNVYVIAAGASPRHIGGDEMGFLLAQGVEVTPVREGEGRWLAQAAELNNGPT
jgi:hypothetical protein